MFPSELLKCQIFICVLCLCLSCLNIWNPSYGFSKSSEDSGGRIPSVCGAQRSQLNYLPLHKMKLENQKLYNRVPGEVSTDLNNFSPIWQGQVMGLKSLFVVYGARVYREPRTSNRECLCVGPAPYVPIGTLSAWHMCSLLPDVLYLFIKNQFCLFFENLKYKYEYI